ncbi:DUF2125 domain-containing protein [Rhizobium sp. CSW-27]|uniref:DUF2125 domain-containing protein n=1 Tax=Rhizobium sp. CSW-27 TaxID=2839985 RepID=UPI001C017138|nr:DUF2125 domain-containing protein [Rhizobium sp. CSW-27]MBT9370798.1 DUF2125 domain-containing protein [Rhizobium sp. CSW-27]
MAASSRSGVSAKIWALAALIVVAIALYTAGWFYAAATLKANTLAALGKQQDRGVTAECADATYRGYPFRIGLFCSKVTIDDSAKGISASFGALRSAAQVYAPSHILWELDGPSELRTGNGLSVTSQWNDLQASLNTVAGGLERSSTVIRGLTAAITSSQTGQAVDLKVEQAEIHARQNGADLDAALTLRNSDLTARGLPLQIPRFTAVADVTLAGKAGLLEGQDDTGTGLYGTKGEIRQLGIDLGDGQILSVSGPISIDTEGRLSGKLKLQVEKIGAWRERLSGNFPQLAKTIDTASKMLSALTGGGDSASLDLTLNRGKILVGGFIAVGEIPPL